MAEHGAFLWNRSPDRRPWDDYEVDPAALGASAEVVAALTEWNDRYQRLSLSEDPPWPSEDQRVWRQEGLHLAYRLQHELGPDVDVLYHQDGDEAPVSGRRGR